MSTLGRTVNHLSFSQKMIIHDLLKASLDFVEETDGVQFWRFKDTLTDESLALTAPFPCTKANVQGLRMEVFGKLASPLPSDYNPDLALLAKRVETLEQFNKDLIASYVKLLFIVNGLSPASITDEWALKQESKLHD